MFYTEHMKNIGIPPAAVIGLHHNEQPHDSAPSARADAQFGPRPRQIRTQAPRARGGDIYCERANFIGRARHLAVVRRAGGFPVLAGAR